MNDRELAVIDDSVFYPAFSFVPTPHRPVALLSIPCHYNGVYLIVLHVEPEESYT